MPSVVLVPPISIPITTFVEFMSPVPLSDAPLASLGEKPFFSPAEVK
jgi:hypothetical protein